MSKFDVSEWGIQAVIDAEKVFGKAIVNGISECLGYILKDDVMAYLKLDKEDNLICRVNFDSDYYELSHDYILSEWVFDDIEQEYMNAGDADYHRRLIKSLRVLADKAEKQLDKLEAEK